MDMSDAGPDDRDERPFLTDTLGERKHTMEDTLQAAQSKEGGAEREELATCVNLPGPGMM